MGITIWFLTVIALLVILYVYEDKQNQAYLAELEILDEPYMRLLAAGVLSAPNNNRHENRSQSHRPPHGEPPAHLRHPR